MKTEKDPLKINMEFSRFAKEGWESISEDDVQRLKWFGWFLRVPTPGYFMIRVRVPNGFTYSHQIRVLADISKRFGNGVIDLTTRMAIELRNLKIENIEEIHRLMDDVGLTSMQTGLDNVRNIMGCPVAGLHPKELLDASPIVQGLTEKILNNPAFTNLPRKVNVAITGCPDNCIHSESQDLALVPALHGDGDNPIAGFNVMAGGKLGSGGYRIASSLDIFVLPEEAIELCSVVIAIYNEFGDRESRTTNRLGFLIDEWGVDRFRFELVKRLQRSLPRAGEDYRNKAHKDHIGIYRQRQPLMNYVGLKVTVGRMQASDLTDIADQAEKYGDGKIRLTANQGFIIPNVSDNKLGAFLEEPLIKKFPYNPVPVHRNLVSCVGNDYCGLATIETKSRAVEIADKLSSSMESAGPISMHWSGCPASCGNHLLADIGFLGKRAKYNGKTVEAVDVFMGGRAGPNPKKAVKVLENVPCEHLPSLLEWVIPYHAREKMHIDKGARKAKKKAKKKEAEMEASVQ